MEVSLKKNKQKENKNKKVNNSSQAHVQQSVEGSAANLSFKATSVISKGL